MRGLVFLVIAAPWHILIALANPTQGHPGNLAFTDNHHWLGPAHPPTATCTAGLWFYFVNEQLSSATSTSAFPATTTPSPLWLFWGLCFIWIMPWSAFAFRAIRLA
jgi:hypothetical protein